MRNRILFIVPNSATSNSFASEPCNSVQFVQGNNFKKGKIDSKCNKASFISAITITTGAENNSASFTFFNNSFQN